MQRKKCDLFFSTGLLNIVQQLIKAGANIDNVDDDGFSIIEAIIGASKNNNPIVKVTIQNPTFLFIWY